MPLLRTDDSLAGPILRLTLAGAMFPHGAQKVLEWFGGRGADAPTDGTWWQKFEAWAQGFAKFIDMPVAVAYMVAAAEFLGSILLVLGFMTRFCALSIAAVMAGAVYYAHWKHGFFMNWHGALPAGTEGWEYHLLAFGCALALVARGGGLWSLDRRMTLGRPAPV